MFINVLLRENLRLTRKRLRLVLITPTAIIMENITLNLDMDESENL